ncbi:SusC/RagA family TonB-linked outer membrane protein [Aquimarina intermedia]|uniref:TonB-linked SusC/RagA family outer membrane protein n=1 Tax=Aquimarina intermedia TaxID=350814 RepID=A0A5S5C683_9FLAO|nr:SusC/RagA family TonB-linked outer membrane protein [Aquimarina intermedia]TYP73483.1 TonB-linked SusC/RagA family outer membrane protein [Aquimarina intermedia]
MKTKFNGILTLFLALIVHVSFAQQKTVTGKVTDDSGLPLPGVNIVIKNTSSGTQTDFDGLYTISSAEGSILVFSYLGFADKEVAVSSNATINVQLEASAAELEEVVVTALGVKSNPRELSYSVQTVTSDDIQNTGETNLVNSLSAKSAGVSITSSSGSVGASANIRIRGNTSVLRTNSPLFVVDGVPIDNSSENNGNDGLNDALGGTDQSNRAIDINPNDIASINILKGIAAQTLYGLRAANGVVLITTKKGRTGKPIITISSNVQFSEQNKLPGFQKEYAQGRPVGGVATYRGPETFEGFSWGPAISSLEFDGDSSYPYDRNGRLVPAGTGNGRPAVAYDNSDFFVTGVLTDLNISVRGGTEKTKYYMSAGNTEQSGISPTELFERKSFRLDLSTMITEKLELSASGNFVNSGGTRVQRGSNISGITLGLFRTTPTFDNGNGLSGRAAASNPDTYTTPDGGQRSYRAGVYDNPYWTVAKNPTTDDLNRFIGRASFEYKPTDWVTLKGVLGYDRYSDVRKSGIDVGSATNNAGSVFDNNLFNENINTQLLALFNKNINEDISFNGLIGYDNYSTNLRIRNVLGNGLTIPGFFQISNSSSQINFENIERKRVDAFISNASFGYKDLVFLNGSLRNDWSSALPDDTNSFTSYSTGLSFVFTELFESSTFNYGKLRASYGKTGNDAPIYSTITYYTPGLAGGDGFITPNEFPIFSTVAFEQSVRLGNDDIRPEVTTEVEFGGEFKFFDSRLSLDVTYYEKETEDQVIPVDQSPTTGFTERVINAGTISNKGWEIVGGLAPIRTNDFNWNIDVNFTTFENTVEELAPNVENILLSGFNSTSSRVIAGESFGAIFGSKYQRDDNGNILIGDDGWALVDSEDGIIGDPIPDWTMGIRNTFTYKDFSVTALLDIRQGGDIWCGTCGIIDYFGVSEKTGDLRNQTVVFEGIRESDGQPNTTAVSLADPANGLGGNAWVRNGFGGVSEDNVYDASWVRLREVALTYTLSSKIIDRIPLTSASLTVSGRNLWLDTDYPGVDPETNLTGASNGIGLDYFNQPNTKSYAVSLKLNF